MEKFKIGDLVKVERAKGTGPQSKEFSSKAEYGEIVWIHPNRIFYTVQFCNSKGKPIYKESFFADRMGKVK